MDPADYKQPVAGAELARLKTIFPEGVCDYSRIGVEQAPIDGVWLSY